MESCRLPEILKLIIPSFKNIAYTMVALKQYTMIACIFVKSLRLLKLPSCFKKKKLEYAVVGDFCGISAIISVGDGFWQQTILMFKSSNKTSITLLSTSFFEASSSNFSNFSFWLVFINLNLFKNQNSTASVSLLFKYIVLASIITIFDH